jgi:hypothetical protein
MDVAGLHTQTDYYAKSDSDAFPEAEKLAYYNEGQAILNGLIIQQQEDRAEEEDTKTTIAGQAEYQEKARIHHINWLKINYGDGFIPARYMSEASLIAQYGSELETVLTQWDQGDPIYNYKGRHFFVRPAPSAAQAGADRLKTSMELLPEDLVDDADEPAIIPATFHYLLAAYSAMKWLEADDPLFAKAKNAWDEGTTIMLDTMYPRARQAEMVAGTPDDDGSEY